MHRCNGSAAVYAAAVTTHRSVPSGSPIPKTVVPRFELSNLDASFCVERWGPCHHREADNGRDLFFWAFQLESGVFVVFEHVGVMRSLIVHSDSVDTAMLRWAFGLEGLEGGDMRPSNDLRCRVCGLSQQQPPWSDFGRTPAMSSCACCGTEFGYHDVTVVMARKTRALWLAKGAAWAEPGKRPPDWDLQAQLRNVPPEFADAYSPAQSPSTGSG